MLSYLEALDRIMATRPELPPETVFLDRLIGRTLASDVKSKFDLPFFTNSAVDGYAIAATDLDSKARLRVVGTIAAGDVPASSLTPGTALRTMTGAPVPEGAAAVVMQEDVIADEGDIVLQTALHPGKNIRAKGKEFRAGDLVLERGTVVTPPVVSSLAGMGYQEADVLGLPSVAVLATGDELLSPGGEARDGQVYESNTFALQASLRCAGVSTTLELVGDDRSAVVRALSRLYEHHDIVLTCGGLSVGLFDHVRDALTELGFQWEVERVAIKPGKPFSYAVGEGGKRAYCLPGNPMSALVTFALFVWPALIRPLARTTAVMANDAVNHGDRTEFVPSVVLSDASGRLTVDPSPTLGSHALAGLVGCGALLEVPPKSCLGKGDRASALLLPWRPGW
ncbi:MAG: molybdopterin molybdotransferase MoeA [Armatimonadetes bacterium]|nr:molybdopterin molybdotransferase MoeA [Armatimonadota bacterium]